jgi:hypothetical protein
MAVFEGLVKHKLIGKGSKSERQAIVLETDEQEYVLRRQGANPFADMVLEKLIGKTISVVGIVHGYTLLISGWHEII